MSNSIHNTEARTPAYTVASFYKFVPLEAFENLKEPLLALMREHQILGTILLASEGINGSFAAKTENMSILYDFLRADPRFADLEFKENPAYEQPFDKAKVKFRKEIVTLGVPGVDPLKNPGIRVQPEDWNALIQDPEVLVVDTRNDYEYEVGSFKNAINPKTENFRDFPAYVNTHLADKKDRKIAMFCTGGIRCEKSTAYLRDQGFEQVYQLEGGILNYFKAVPEEESLWEGRCFVFDERITIPAQEID